METALKLPSSLRLACLATVAVASVAFADTDPRLTRLDGEIGQLQRERDRLAGDEQGVIGKLERLEAEARLLDAERERLALELQAARRTWAQAQRENQAAQLRLEQQRERFGVLANLIRQVGPFGPFRPLLLARDSAQFSAGLRLAQELSRRQLLELEKTRDEANLLAKTEAALQQEAARLAAKERDAQLNRQALSEAIDARRALLERIREEQQIREQALAELARAGEEWERRLANGGNAAIELDITRFKRLLDPPAGRQLRPFGDRVDPRFGTHVPHPGWDLERAFGSVVQTVFDGKVVFADWFRGYGLTVVVDHGHGVHTIYARLSAITAPVGTVLARGESLGRSGDTGSWEGPELYFEIRVGGKAQDPALWFKEQR